MCSYMVYKNGATGVKVIISSTRPTAEPPVSLFEMDSLKKAFVDAQNYFLGPRIFRPLSASSAMIELVEAAYRQPYPSQNPREIQKDVRKTVTKLLNSYPDLMTLTPPPDLLMTGEECDTLWRWLVKNDQVNVITYVALNADSKNWLIPTNKTDQKNGSSLFTDPTITLSYDMFCTLHYIAGEMFDGVVNLMTDESVLHVLARKNDVFGNGMALKIMKEVVVYSSENIDPDLVDKVEGKNALDYALARGDTNMAWLLVNAFGADWGLAEDKVGPNAAGCVKLFLEECRRLYGIRPNAPVEEASEKTCFVCLEEMVRDMYKMGCCGNFTHAECLRRSLKRPMGGARCMICRRNLCDELFSKMPGSLVLGPAPSHFTARGRYAGASRLSGGLFVNDRRVSSPPLRALIAVVDYVMQ